MIGSRRSSKSAFAGAAVTAEPVAIACCGNKRADGPTHDHSDAGAPGRCVAACCRWRAVATSHSIASPGVG